MHVVGVSSMGAGASLPAPLYFHLEPWPQGTCARHSCHVQVTETSEHSQSWNPLLLRALWVWRWSPQAAAGPQSPRTPERRHHSLHFSPDVCKRKGGPQVTWDRWATRHPEAELSITLPCDNTGRPGHGRTVQPLRVSSLPL